VIEFAFESIDYDSKTVVTPTNAAFHGVDMKKSVVGVSVVRSGEVMEAALRSTIRQARIGKILLQREAESSFEGTRRAPTVFYVKLPSDITSSTVMLMDPMLGTGGTACMAIKTLLSSGAKEEDIRLVSLICTAQGVNNVLEKFPKVQIVTTFIDNSIDENKFITPGLGDFADRYFGTGSS
jgi:uracil phosphoribosyltransferase